MPRLIEVDESASVTLEECIAGLDTVGFDPRDEARLLEAAHWLRKLGNNRTFLGDLLLAELTGSGAGMAVGSAYTPQSIMLSGYRPGYFLRANIWPAASDPVCKASGGGTFAYGLPHDHNFDFLTLGYHGPGYASDYWEYDYENVLGIPGELAGLHFTGRRVLTPGTILHYRAYRDVHAQHPPESLSVSINVMATDPVQGWYDQYRFDSARDRIIGALSPNSTETFLRIAVACRNENALDLASHIGTAHPSDRLRLAAFEARAELDPSPAAQETVWREGLECGSRMVARMSRDRLAALS